MGAKLPVILKGVVKNGSHCITASLTEERNQAFKQTEMMQALNMISGI